MTSNWRSSIEAAGIQVTPVPIGCASRNSWSAADLIQLAKEHPPEPIIEGLLFKGDILVLHGKEESYKSVFVVQIAESIACGRPLLRRFNVPQARRVGLIETEMHPTMMGKRLAQMFPDGKVPEQMLFMKEETLKNWRRADLPGKVAIIAKWVESEKVELLIIDTANDFFRGEHNPSDERHVGELFDLLRNLSLKGIMLVRHDHKKREGDSEGHSNELIRGSAEWKEDPEVILHLERPDKRTHEAHLEVGKLRYCAKPEPLTVWFDAQCFRLTPLPPVIAALEAGRKTRQQLIDHCKVRFGIAERLMEYMIQNEDLFLQEGREGHNRTYELHPERSLEAKWAGFLTHPGA